MTPVLPSGFSPGPTPTFQFAVRLGVGASSTPDAGLLTLLLAAKVGDGTAANHVAIDVGDATEAEALFGARSRAAAGVRAFRQIAPRGRLMVCPVAPAAGAVAATAVLSFAGPATGAGVLRLRVSGRAIREVVLPPGTTGAGAAALARAALDDVAELLCTAAVGGAGSEHVLTLTAANAGDLGNQLRVVFEVTAAGITVALNGAAASVRGKAYFGSSAPAVAGVGAADLTQALSAVAGARYDRVIVDADDDVARTAIKAFVQAQSSINVGRRCMAVMTSFNEVVTGAGSVAEDAQALNEARITVLHQRRPHQTGVEIAAAYMAAKVYGDGRLPGEVQYRAAKANGLSLYPAVLASDEEERLTPLQIDLLLRAGVTPLGADPMNPGWASIVRPVTTRTRNAAGGLSYAVADTSKVAVSDLVADRMEAWASTAYADKNLVPDPPTIEQAPGSPWVVWPEAVREDLLTILNELEQEALVVDVARHAPLVTVAPVVIEGVTYLVCRAPFDVIAHLHSVVGEAIQNR